MPEDQFDGADTHQVIVEFTMHDSQAPNLHYEGKHKYAAMAYHNLALLGIATLEQGRKP